MKCKSPFILEDHCRSTVKFQGLRDIHNEGVGDPVYVKVVKSDLSTSVIDTTTTTNFGECDQLKIATAHIAKDQKENWTT